MNVLAPLHDPCPHKGFSSVGNTHWYSSRSENPLCEQVSSRLPVFEIDTAALAGNGLFCRLDLPLSLEREQLAECAHYLNVYETTGVNTPPFFGVWCGELDNRTLSYIGFWPNCMYKKGMVANISSWCKVRSQLARQAIGNMGRGC